MGCLWGAHLLDFLGSAGLSSSWWGLSVVGPGDLRSAAKVDVADVGKNGQNRPMTTTYDKKTARNFRKWIRKLFELGEPRIEVGARGAAIKVVADFGGHRVLLGGFEGDELDQLLMLLMRARAAAPGGHKSPAMVSAFKAMAEGEAEGEAEVCSECGEDMDDCTKACADTEAAALVRAEADDGADGAG